MEKNTVYIERCKDYKKDDITKTLNGMIKPLLKDISLPDAKKILLKPNLLSATPAEKAVTTDPVFVESVIDCLLGMGAKKDNILIADSPGIVVPYTEKGLGNVYEVTGLSKVSEKTGIRLNYDTGLEMLELKKGRVVKKLEIIRPAAEADIIINLPKFKTHNLTTITGAVKNMYGVIHGRSKTLYHTKFLEVDKFYELLFDVITLIRPTINIMDGILGLEGEGPGSSGSPRHVGLLLASLDPVAMDLVVAGIMGIGPGEFPMQRIASERGMSSYSMDNIEIAGPQMDGLVIGDFKRPKGGSLDRITANRFINTYLLPFMRNKLHPLPKPDHDKCNLCESCIDVCPQECISLENDRIKIDYNKCIRCYCCSEMCPQGSILLKESLMTKLLAGMIGKN